MSLISDRFLAEPATCHGFRRTALVCAALLSLVSAAVVGRPEAEVEAGGDPLPIGAVARIGTDRFVPIDRGVSALAVSPDGNHIVSVGSSGSVQRWESTSGRRWTPRAGWRATGRRSAGC